MRADPDALSVGAECEAAIAHQMQAIIEEHVNRFAYKEGTLQFAWEMRPSARP